jgi:regulator of sirC expression with transglutaminase-like and TPR domain
LTVQVRLNDESGAAGLVFHADGGDKHYGFYPSNGQLRLTCFDGPSVFQWQVLQERPSDFYRRGEWNRLRVRVDKAKLLCYVNDHLVMESADTTFGSGKVGLAKFRNTEAEFKQFQVAKELNHRDGPNFLDDRVNNELGELPSLAALLPERIAALANSGEAAIDSLRRKAREMELRASELQRLARDVHVSRVASELAGIVQHRDDGFDLLRAGLWIAKLDEEDIDVDGYIHDVDRMAHEITSTLAKDANDDSKLAAMNEYLFRQNGFHGSRFDYYQRAMSLKIEGVGLPGHFVVRFVPAQGEPRLIDVFDQGTTITREDAERIVRGSGGSELQEPHLRALSKRMTLARMLSNLKGIAERERDLEGLLRYTEASLALDPDSVEERLRRASLRGQSGRVAACLADLDWIIERQPPGVNVEGLREFRDRLQNGQR